MDFSISIEQESIIESVNKFLSKNITPLEQIEYDKKGTAPYHLMEGMAELGLFGMPFPEKYGGSNVGWDTIALIQEHMGKKAYMAASLLNRTIGFGGMSILKFGNTDQKSQIIPEIIKGKILFSLALSETGAGSDAAAIVTQAKRASNDTWSIKGNKIWVSDAAESKYMVVACRTDMKTSGASGITLFLVKPSTPGVIITPMRKIGTNWMPSYDVNFDEVIVSDKNMLGDENGGFKHLPQ